jgi:hypothetical protein
LKSKPPELTPAPSETVAALQAFRKRHSDAQRITGQLNAQPTTVDFAHYRSVLKNKAIVDEAEKILRDFKPVTYDASAHVKAIETFETKAVRRAPLSFFASLCPTIAVVVDWCVFFFDPYPRCARLVAAPTAAAAAPARR